MSTFQYYEFLAIDRPLSAADKTYVSSLSSRAQPTSTRVVFTYSYSDFSHPPETVLLRCFDLMVYMANWGAWRLLFRLPKSQIDLPALQRYVVEDHIMLKTKGEDVLLDIYLFSEEGGYGGWIDEDNSIADDVAPLRQDLFRGDYRLLYLAWLSLAQLGMLGGDKGDIIEPPVPSGLEELSPALQAFVDWVELDQDLVSAAAIASEPLGLPKADPVEDWVRSLSDEERIELLVQIAQEETVTGRQLLALLRQRAAAAPAVPLAETNPRRTFAALEAIADAQGQERSHREQVAAAKKRHQYLDNLAKQTDQIWEQVERLSQDKKASSYDQVVTLLVDLREVAEIQGQMLQFQARFQKVVAQVKPTSTLYKRLKSKGF